MATTANANGTSRSRSERASTAPGLDAGAPDVLALRERLSEFYGRQVAKTGDLTEGACCPAPPSKDAGEVARLLPDEVVARRYGCGCPVPPDDLTGRVVLDLGSGAGFDAFVLAHKVGPTGFVHGVDMTPEQLAVARRAIPEVTRRFGFARPNVAFHEGFVETCEAIADQSVDVVVSDCVLNLSPAKDAVWETIWRVLKPGGEAYISDVAADRRVPPTISEDPRLVAECLGGALYEHDWLDLMRDVGFADPRVASRRVLRRDVKGEPITFSSLLVRAFKLPALDRRCEDYGQSATYLGTIRGAEARFVFDDHHAFEARRPTPVCRNTARMLSETRLGPHFEVSAPLRHFGLFGCGPAPAAPAPSAGGSCC